MGALSSWSSLAITHHFLVQVAAWHSGVVPLGVWFTDYAIVGDDVVIGDTRVKDSYLLILSALGMPVNQNKSILSPMGAGLEFCKRTFFKGTDVSPIPVQEFISANLTLSGAIAYMQKYSLTVPELLRSLGYGYRVLGGLGKHVGQLNARVRSILFASMLPKLEAGSPVTDQDIGALLSMGNPLVKSEESANEVLFLFLFALKSLVAFHLYKIEKMRIDLSGLVAQEMIGFRSVLSNRLLNAYLIEQATNYRDGKFSGNLTDPNKPLVWTGEVEFPTLPDKIKPGSVIPMINLNVPIEVLMGFRDLLASFEEPMEELLQLMLQESLSRRSRLIKELKLELKAFKPTQDSVLEGFRAAVRLLKLLTELMDINPVMDRRLASIPKSHGHHINEQLWHLYTMVINDVTQQNKLFERAASVTKIPVDARVKTLLLKYLGKG
jgi:hypothetical protein